ncbi:hypothetical protein [Brevibacillus fluminis]|uniref:hypothetical protein n=1 Tax=Brevibacillus fluminis TaxID=511487 RepID=UPI001605CEE8|nr:hypothetical protein [Brevibacillus fluminis]
MLKKGSLLLLAMLLLLTGCSGQAALVRDSVVATIDKPNYEFQGTLKLLADVDKLEKLPDTSMSSDEKKEMTTVLRALAAGVTLQGVQNDLHHAKITFTANDDKPLRDKGFWTGDKKAAADLLIDDNKLYVKSPIDAKYLLIDNTSPLNETGIDAKKFKDFQDQLNKLTLEFMKKYISKYGYTLSQVKNLGTETVKLPNGESVQATHIAISLDLKELIKMFYYTANDATANADVRAFAIDVATLFSKFQQDQYPTEKPLTDAQLRAEATTSVDMGIAYLKGWLAQTQKDYPVDKVVELAKQEGLLAVNLDFDYLIGSDKLPVSQKATVKVTFDPKVETVKEPITIGFESNSLVWNYGKAPQIAYPKATEAVTLDTIYNDEKALSNFNDKGYLYAILKSVKEDHDAEQEYWDDLYSDEGEIDPVTTPAPPAPTK